MKTRSISRTNPCRQWFQSKSVGAAPTETWSFPATYYDIFQVIVDYTGPKDPKTFHSHMFSKTLSSDYVGEESSDAPGAFSGVSGRTRSFTRHGSPGTFTPNVDFASLHNQALSRVFDQIRGQVDLAVTLAEGKQTIRMVRQASNLVKFVRSFSPKNWANKWLEYQYGWRPLVQDIYNTGKQLMDKTVKENITVVGRAKQSEFGVNIYTNSPFAGSTETVLWNLQSRAKIEAEFSLSNSAIQRLSGYTSLNPASIAWELLPYSFVVDWVYDIGGYIRNLESEMLFATNLKKAYVVYGYRLLFDGKMNGGGPSFPGSSTYNSAAASAYAVYSFKDRHSINLLPRFPSLKLDLGWQRLTSAASLLSQHLGKRGRG